MEAVKSGFNLRGSALDDDPPRDRGVERDLRHALLPAQNPQASWIADRDHPIFGRDTRRRSLETGLIELGHCVVGAQGQSGDPGGDNEPATRQISKRRGEDSLLARWYLSQPDNFLSGQRVAAFQKLQQE